MDMSHIPDLITPAIPVFVITVIAEALWVRKLRQERGESIKGHTWKDTFASLSMGLGNVAVSVFWKGVAFAGYAALYHLTPLRLGHGLMAWVLLFFLEDLCYYAFHRVHHESRFFWASHVVHHSSQHYNLSTALRQTWTPMTGWVFWVPLALLGFSPEMIVTQQAVSLLYQYWIHTEAIDRLPRPVEWLFNTPSHHRAHHASNAAYIDVNYAGILIIWDRLFGTFVPETERPIYGLTKNLTTHNPVRIAFHEFAAIARDAARPGPLSQRLGYIFRNPAWKPKGASQPSESPPVEAAPSAP
ncbi:sterol desaturase family protein [Corallococcus sp. AB045]|uniref:sterol desaturase family protein n=1 Tax=Corallococcus sp. AB045 TaxID=2316719 RepID=UPI000EED4239|nr:sterol desaturase family protein [Corallococcus sp. AB045]RKH80422.1 sterol desaturase family protein [Corallococcus sp. AB045]